ncbi:MBL fold metallo-hydrolase [Acetobacteraceae bacterium H6797]|nr:MBL fold metallo-hydrolase [Acetobacteraceae bacterium H6797]
MPGRVIILGCGGSGGVPLIGGGDGRGQWGVCDPAEARNRRTRSSIVIEGGDGRRLLVDTGPDLHRQLLDCGVGRVDAIFYTHTHADHIMGLDDVRGLNRTLGDVLPAYGTAFTLEDLERRFEYAFKPSTAPSFFRPALAPHPILPGEVYEMAGMAVRVFRQDHKVMETLGLRMGDFAYSTDVVEMPEESFAQLQGLDTWIVDCFQRQPHPVHAWLERVLLWVERIRPRRTILTHMGTDMDWAWMHDHLPAGVEPAHDGMIVPLP